MSEVTLTIDSQTMWKAGVYLLSKLRRGCNTVPDSCDEIMDLTEEEFGEEYGCSVGGQQFDDGVPVNRRDLTFKSEADATMFLLRWA